VAKIKDLKINFLVLIYLVYYTLILSFFSVKKLKSNARKHNSMLITNNPKLNKFYYSIKVQKISKYIFVKSCLTKSIFLYKFLRCNNFQPVIKIGVRKRKNKLLSHAWVEVNKEPINNDEQDLNLFKIIERFD